MEGSMSWCQDCGSILNTWDNIALWVSPKQQELEIVICSAIMLPGGKIFRGHRHADCIETAFKFVTWNAGNDPGEHHWNPNMCREQGFITSKNRYVGREKALQLQLNAGIESACPSGYRTKELFSEDLY